jgi:hypothetical protein
MARSVESKYTIKLQDKTKKAFKAIGRGLNRTRKAVFSLKTGMVSAAGIAGIGYLVKQSMDATDELGKMSRTIGVSVENLSRLRHAASIGGMESKQLDKAIQKLSVNMADMSRGVGLAKDVFKKYGIEVTNSDGTLRSVTDVMSDVADVTAGMTNKTEKADLAYKLFGARGAGLINVLEGGSKAMHDSMLEADKLGITMTTSMVAGVEKANDAITRLKSFMTAAFSKAIANLAPLIEKVTNNLREWATAKIDENDGIGNVARSIANSVIYASISIVESIQMMGNSLISFGQLIEKLPGMGKRGLSEIQQDITSLEMSIGMLKASANSGTGLLDLLGVGDESSLGIANERLKELNQELTESKDSFTSIEKIDLSHITSSLSGMLIPIEAVSKEAEKLKKTADDLTGNKKGATKTAAPTIWDQMKTGFESYKNSVKSGTASIASITENALNSTADALTNMMMGVKTDWKSLARSILADLMKLSIRKAMFSGSGGGIAGLLGFANGGRPPVGVPSVVGEAGAELFIPDRAGTIIPNNQLGGGGKSVNVSFNITANDTTGFDDLLESRRGMIVGLINNAMNDRGISGVTA